ncbi:MAG: alpha-L-arabinofuranosidase C-terminal domain-containing protein [bacterium]
MRPISRLSAVLILALLSAGAERSAAVDGEMKARIRVNAGKVVTEVNPMIYGHFIEHLGKCIRDGLWTPGARGHELVLGGVRRDVFQAISELQIPLLRWPGGCFADGYHWRDGIGQTHLRPVRKNQAWGGQEDNLFGTDEFLKLCAELGIEPLINVNLGSGTAEEAREWVEYVNAPADTPPGSLRARNGRPAPYRVRYWGIGNESWGAHEIGSFRRGRDYAEKYLSFHRAMKQADPAIKVMAVGALPPLIDWNKEVLEAAADSIDFLSLHIYFPSFIFPRKYKKKEDMYYGIVASGRKLEELLEQFDADIRRYGGKNPDIRIALDEWNLWWDGQQIIRAEDYELSSALFTADVLARLQRWSDRVAFANFAQLVNVLGAIITDENSLFLTPSYLSFLLFRRHSGELLVESSTDGPVFRNLEFGIVPPMSDNPLVECSATLDAAGGKLSLIVINKHYDKPVETEIGIAGFPRAGAASVWEINGDSPHAMNSFAEPDAVRIVEKTAVVSSDPFIYTLPPHSVTAIVLTRDNRRE